MASDSSKQLVQKLYVAYYGRPADPSGLNFWADVVDVAGGVITDSIVNAFGTSQEFTNRFGTFTNEQLIDNLYLQMFGRAADSAGKTFYLNLLNSGQSTLAEIALDIANGAQGTDKTTLDNRVIAAQHFTDQVEAQGLSFTEANVPDLQTLLAQVTDDSVTVVQVKQQMDSYIATTLGGTTGRGQAFTLTDSGSGSGSGDNITGTSENDTITGGATTLDSDDVINGGAGTDKLRADLAVDAGNVAPTIRNVEELTFANPGFAGAGLIFSNIEVSAATSVIFEIAGGDLSATQLPEGMSATLQNWAEGTTATFAPANPGGTNTISLTLKDVKSAHLHFPSYETVTLNSQGSPSSNYVVLGAGSAATGGGATGGIQPTATLVLQGSSNITIEDFATQTAGLTASSFFVGNTGTVQGSALTGTFTLQLGSNSGVTYNLGNANGVDKVDLGTIPANTGIGINGMTGGQDVYLAMTASDTAASGANLSMRSGGTTALFDFNVRSATNTANTADTLSIHMGLCAQANSTAAQYHVAMSGMSGIEVINVGVTTASNSAVLNVQIGNSAANTINTINFNQVDPGLGHVFLKGRDPAAAATAGTALVWTALHSLSFSAATATDFRIEGIGNSASTAAITVMGGGGDDFIAVAADNNSKVTIDGGAGNDTILGAGVQTANNGVTAISALAANVGMASGLGDSLVGGAGDDWLVGGAGADTLVGGDGRDVFVFKVNTAGSDGQLSDASAGQQDLISDFGSGDQIWLAFSGFNTAAIGFAQSAVSAGGAAVVSTSDANWFGGTISAVATASLTSIQQTGNCALLMAIYGNGDNTFIEFTIQTATATNTNFNSAGDAFNRIELAGYSSAPTTLKLESFGSGIMITVV